MRPTRLMAVSIVLSFLLLAFAPAAFASEIDAVSFRDSSTGFISGGFYDATGVPVGFASRTDDGGLTWRASRIPNVRLRAVAAAPAGAFATGDWYDWVVGTTDVSGVWANTGATRAAADASLFGVAQLPGGRIVAVGERQVRSKYAVITSSTDGGLTWTKQFDGPIYPPTGDAEAPSTYASLAGIDVATDGTAWVVGNEWKPQGSTTTFLTYDRRLVFRSVDGGATWSMLTVPATTGAKAMATLVAVDANTMWAFGEAGQYIKTTDGGATWTQGWLTAPANMNIYGAEARGNTLVLVGRYQSGLYTYQRKVVWSTNGGTSWSPYIVPGVSSAATAMRGITMLSDTEWLAVGSHETIVRTTNGGTTWSGQTAVTPPNVGITAPSAGFPLSALPVTIGGTASDAGVGVAAVEYQIRRSDGQIFNGAGWTGADVWLPAQTTDSWATWSTPAWTPDAATLATGMLVTVTARATDGVGSARVSAGVTSGVPFSASISLAGGDPYTTATQVPVAVSASGATHMRWRVGTGDFVLPWASFAPTATVSLPAGDGPKNVTFQFSSDGGTTVLGSAEDSITLHTTPPVIAMTQPSSGFALSSQPVTVSGTASDVSAGVAGVEVLIRRADGRSWNGTAWAVGDTWRQAGTQDGYATWRLLWTPDAEVLASGELVSVTSRAHDLAGLTATTDAVHLVTPIDASVTLNGGAASTQSTAVTATISVQGTPPTDMRWSIAGQPFTTWSTFKTTVGLELPAVDGVKTVVFEFSADGGGSVVATASDSIELIVHVPPATVSVASPSAGFTLASGTTDITGVAADEAHGVASVQVRIRRANGDSWDGDSWAAAETWLDAQTSDAWAHWGVTWTPALADIAHGGIVTITPRVRDGVGVMEYGQGVSSAAPVAASAALSGGASHTATVAVTADLSAPGASHVRWRVGDAPPVAWRSITQTAAVTLTSGDGTKTVTFEFSADGGAKTVAQAADDIVLDATAPSARFTSPTRYFSKAAATVTFSATSTDALSGLKAMRMSIVRNGLYWDSSVGAWTAEPTWAAQTTADAPASLSFVWALDAVTAAGTLPATVTVVAEDAAGNTASAVSFARPKAKPYLTAPSATWLPTRPVRNRYYYAIGYAKHSPFHSLGAYAGTVQAYRYERQANGGYRWVLRRSWKAAAYTSGRYRARIALPYAGTWRLRVYHPEDSVALTGYSSVRTVYVR